MVSTIEELDEMRARAMHEVGGFLVSSFEPWLHWAKIIREADERTGLVTVPKEPGLAAEMLGDALMREHIRDELTDSAAIYQIMVNASPFAKDGGDK